MVSNHLHNKQISHQVRKESKGGREMQTLLPRRSMLVLNTRPRMIKAGRVNAAKMLDIRNRSISTRQEGGRGTDTKEESESGIKIVPV